VNVKSILAKTSQFSVFPGELYIEVSLAEGAWRVSALKLAEEILKAARSFKTPVIVLTGAVSADENLDSGEFIQACLNQGLMPVVELSGQEAPVWMSLAPTRIVHLRSPKWLLYPAAEVIYRPSSLEDPQTDPVLHAKTAFVLDPNPSAFDPEMVLGFLRASRIHWRLRLGGVLLKKDLSSSLRKLEEDAKAALA